MSQLDGCDREERETQQEREAVSQGMRVWALVSLHQQPGMPPLSLAKHRKEHPGCIQGDQDQTHLDVCYKFHTSSLGFSFFSWILFAAIILLGLVCDDWPLCILDVRLMAKEAILQCSGEEKKAMGDCVGEKALTILKENSNSLRT